MGSDAITITGKGAQGHFDAGTKHDPEFVYDFEFASIDGGSLPLEKFRGQAMLIVNTASFCGFTNQYKALQKLHETYSPRGFTIVGVPSNDFGHQEPKGESAIKNFCESNFAITFPMTAKYSVSGRSAHPFYRWAGKKLGFIARPHWNFHKYLVSSDGHLIDWFSTPTSPLSSRVIKAIEKALPSAG